MACRRGPCPASATRYQNSWSQNLTAAETVAASSVGVSGLELAFEPPGVWVDAFHTRPGA
eukprot:6178083-Pleurochrysis_carterae.AAC.1